MTWEIVATIIIGALSFAGTVLGAYFSNRRSSALFAYRLEQLEEEVRKHNQLIDRTYNLERDVAVIKEDIKKVEEKI